MIELMIVVAIIGILAAMAIPRFQQFQAKARQSEAKTNLTHIYTLQLTYFADNDSYAEFPFTGFSFDNGNPDPALSCNIEKELGFKLTDCSKVRYAYKARVFRQTFTAEALTGDGVSSTEFGHVAENLVFPGCPVYEWWTINQNKTLRNFAYDDEEDGFVNPVEFCL